MEYPRVGRPSGLFFLTDILDRIEFAKDRRNRFLMYYVCKYRGGEELENL
jgi:hypothetical protein